eukprot:scaffold1617_cov252-Pinguiococcus_pyrenoidosus.AAC.7
MQIAFGTDRNGALPNWGRLRKPAARFHLSTTSTLSKKFFKKDGCDGLSKVPQQGAHLDVKPPRRSEEAKKPQIPALFS